MKTLNSYLFAFVTVPASQADQWDQEITDNFQPGEYMPVTYNHYLIGHVEAEQILARIVDDAEEAGLYLRYEVTEVQSGGLSLMGKAKELMGLRQKLNADGVKRDLDKVHEALAQAKEALDQAVHYLAL